MESSLLRQSYRANFVEQKRFEKEIILLTKIQKSVALDVQKSQREMKRRLQRYRDRQRDLLGESVTGPAMTMEDIMRKHQPRLGGAQTPKQRRKSRVRPATAPPPKVDMSFFLDMQKSKVDLRPSTAASRKHTSEETGREVGKTPPVDPNYRPVIGKRIGSSDMEARYFVDEELEERSSFYKDLTEWRKRNEKLTSFNVHEKVLEFCGIPSKTKKINVKAKWKSVGMVLKFQKLAIDSREEAKPPPPPNLKKFRSRNSMVISPGSKPRSPTLGGWTKDFDRQENGFSPDESKSRNFSTSYVRPISAII